MQRTVNAETRASLRFSVIVQNLDTYCFKGYYLSHNTFLKMQTQGLTAKKFKLKMFKTKKSKLTDRKSSTPPYINNFAKPNCKNTRKKWLKKKNSTLTTRNNAIRDKKKQTAGNIN